MVDTEFYISGKKIFDVGFRPGLVQLADEVGVKVHATNLRKEAKIRVITSGTSENVTLYHESIKKHEIPIIFPEQIPTYKTTEMKEYDGPGIDWNGYTLQYMSAQLSKTMNYSNVVFTDISQKLDNIQSGVSSLNGKNHQVKSSRKSS
jgi:acylphosphatase